MYNDLCFDRNFAFNYYMYKIEFKINIYLFIFSCCHKFKKHVFTNISPHKNLACFYIIFYI